MNKYIKKYIEEYIDWDKTDLGKTLMFIGSSLIIIPIIYMAFSLHIICGIMALGFFVGIIGSLLCP